MIKEEYKPSSQLHRNASHYGDVYQLYCSAIKTADTRYYHDYNTGLCGLKIADWHVRKICLPALRSCKKAAAGE